MDGSNYRVEAERWLTIAEKLLTARDFHGAKTFAIRARESDPRLFEYSDQIICVADIIVAGELRIVNGNILDYYAILQTPHLTQSMELVANQYRKLALLLNPARNRLSFADQAFRLVSEAWMVFSNPSKKVMYDRELQLSQLGQLGQVGLPDQFGHGSEAQASQSPARRSPRFNKDGKLVMEEERVTQPFISESPRLGRHATQLKTTDSARSPTQPPVTESSRPIFVPESTRSARQTTQLKSTESTLPTKTSVAEPSRQTRQVTQQKTSEPPPTAARPPTTESTHTTQSPIRPTSHTEVPSFWTACPYCYILYEYPKVYEQCALRCQNCKRAFHAVMIPSPPVTGKDGSFCCWGFFPLGFSGNSKGKGGLGWSPISAMFATPFPNGGKAANLGKSKQATQSKPKVIFQDDVYVEISDPSEDESDSDDDEWGSTAKKAKNAKGKGTPSKNVKKLQNERAKKVAQKIDDGGNVRGEMAGKGEGSSGKKKGAKDLGKLDLNVMFSNEVEESVPGVSEGNGAGNGDEDNVEGIEFFEGLDEFLSSLPILSAVGDDKVKST